MRLPVEASSHRQMLALAGDIEFVSLEDWAVISSGILTFVSAHDGVELRLHCCLRLRMRCGGHDDEHDGTGTLGGAESKKRIVERRDSLCLSPHRTSSPRDMRARHP